jgi:hypothetical protein
MSIYIIYKNVFFFNFVHYVYMYRMYDVYIYLFLFCVYVVIGVDDFFVLCYFSSVTSRSGLLSVVWTFYVHYYVMPETILCYLIILLYISNLIFFITSQCVVIIVLCPFLQYMYICIQVHMHVVYLLWQIIVFVAFLFLILFYSFFILFYFY